MEIDISRFIADESPEQFSASAMELGPDAGRITWQNALDRAAVPPPFLDTAEKLDAFREFVAGFGAWGRDEIAAWTAQECEALFLQFVAADMRDGGIVAGMTGDEWQEFKRQTEAGNCSGRIGRGHDGAVYFSLSD